MKDFSQFGTQVQFILHFGPKCPTLTFSEPLVVKQFLIRGIMERPQGIYVDLSANNSRVVTQVTLKDAWEWMHDDPHFESRFIRTLSEHL